jgi:hypothetical protein
MSCDPAKLLLLGSGNLLIKDLIGVSVEIGAIVGGWGASKACLL